VFRAGEAPFGNSEHMSKFEIFNHISESPVRLPMFMSMSCKSLLKGLLEKPEERRFSFEQVAQSAWIKGVSAGLVSMLPTFDVPQVRQMDWLPSFIVLRVVGHVRLPSCPLGSRHEPAWVPRPCQCSVTSLCGSR
jgi:hypothetical protein